MASSKSLKLNAKIMREFKPLEILAHLVEIYTLIGSNPNLGSRFIEEIVKDLRSYHFSNFAKITSLVEKRNKLSVDSDVYE